MLTTLFSLDSTDKPMHPHHRTTLQYLFRYDISNSFASACCHRDEHTILPYIITKCPYTKIYKQNK